MRRTVPGGYELDDDRARIDRAEVHRFVSEESYWATGRPREAMDGLIERADRVVGLYRVHTKHRGRSLGVELVRFTVDEGPFVGRRWVLHTSDAHRLYAKFGFAPGERLLERRARYSENGGSSSARS